MKSLISVSAVLIILSLSTSSLYSQSNTPKFGVGVGIMPVLSSDSYETIIAPLTLYFPISTGAFRVEPEFGLYYVSTTEEFTSNSTTTRAEESFSVLKFGVGFFGLNTAQNTTFYYGLRTGLLYDMESFSEGGQTLSVSNTDFYIGPAIGGEFNFSSRFAFGGEIQTVAVFSSDDTDPNVSISTTRLYTRPVLFARVFF